MKKNRCGKATGGGSVNFSLTDAPTTSAVFKSKTNPTQIIFTNSGRVATTNGNYYVYQDFTPFDVISGTYSGSGSLDGNMITESGLITSDTSWGDLGDWSRHLTRQK